MILYSRVLCLYGQYIVDLYYEKSYDIVEITEIQSIYFLQNVGEQKGERNADQHGDPAGLAERL